MDWAKAVLTRDQLVLFPTRLDDAIKADHRVRLLDDILSRLDWTKWEADYHLRRGQPPIHPRILAGAILYGLLTRIRSSRALEEALQVRLDFRWLAEGRSIDHTTLSEFRRKNAAALKDLFVQIGLVAREIGCLPLQTLAFDGTRVRANNRKSATRTPARLRELKQELAQKFTELETKINDADTQDEECLGDGSAHALPKELADVERRQRKIDAALAALQRIEQDGETIPGRLPTTDPESRFMPNKEGGFAPNYTPTATVDAESGLIVAADVLPCINEDKQLVPAVEEVAEQFELETLPAVLGDGLIATVLIVTGENLAACDERGIELYSPLKGYNNKDNPALRDDLTQPVPEADRAKLPTRTIKRDGHKQQQLTKQAFVYDKANDSYRCPQGRRLSYVRTTTEKGRSGGRRLRRRYQASVESCSGCPLRSQCLRGQAQSRSLDRDQYESLRESHAKKMSTESAREKYSRRLHAGERPFAVIKQRFGARQFLLRGLSNVKQEWTWLATAFNLDRLLNLIPRGPDPPALIRPP